MFAAILLIIFIATLLIGWMLIERVYNEYNNTYAWFRMPLFEWLCKEVPFKYIAGIVICIVLFVWSAWHLIIH